MTDKPIAVVLPSWNPDEPRFIVEKATEHTENSRVFKNGECVYNQRLGFAYSVEEIVEVLNATNNEKEQLKEELKDYSDANAQLEQQNKLLKNTLTQEQEIMKELKTKIKQDQI